MPHEPAERCEAVGQSGLDPSSGRTLPDERAEHCEALGQLGHEQS